MTDFTKWLGDFLTGGIFGGTIEAVLFCLLVVVIVWVLALVPFRRIVGWIACHAWSHDMHAECEGMEDIGPPIGHPCRPEPGDSSAVFLRKFNEWTRLSCSRCGHVYKED